MLLIHKFLIIFFTQIIAMFVAYFLNFSNTYRQELKNADWIKFNGFEGCGVIPEKDVKSA